ncbi:transmembrane protein 177-like [Amphiura filiformis]|uniref:transmembrane protein 177-like n=1 Tax=Amphiura filiformis TaxID=82378 RepID=UPI003B22212C
MWRGLPWFSSGVKFGIPEILQDNPDVSTERFPEPIKSKLNSEEGQKLKKALSFSQNARKFALAKELSLIHKNFPMNSIVLAPCFITANFGLVALLQITNLVALPNYILLILLTIPLYCVYQFAMSIITEKMDLKCDEKLIELGAAYREGGVEYYEKRLEKNIALRKLLGKKGEKLFTYYGNEKPGGFFGLRSFGAPITQKLNRMQKALNNK